MPATRYPLHTPALPALGQLLRSAASRIAAGLQRWLDRERRRRAAHAARSLLYALDDRTLHDLGLSRSEVPSVAHDPLDPTRARGV